MILTAKTGSSVEVNRHIGAARGFRRGPDGKVFPEHFISAATVNPWTPGDLVVFSRTFLGAALQTRITELEKKLHYYEMKRNR